MGDSSRILLGSFSHLLHSLRRSEQLRNPILHFMRRVPDLRVGLKTVGQEPRIGEGHGR